jgi:lysophospholipase L1-like esterase
MKKLLPLIFILILSGCEKKIEPQAHVHDAIFIGDSITANWVKESKGHPEFFKEHNYLGLGFSGKTSGYLKTVFHAAVTNKHPKQVVILCGTNDIAQNDGVYVSNEEIRDNIAWMASEAEGSGIKVVLCSVLPSTHFYWASSIHPEDIIIRLNVLIKALAAEKGYVYVDYYSALVDSNKGLPSQYSSDGCHPNQDGYTVMEGLILPVLAL